ncbi:MAG: tetratricopeptide repeat protein [Candidatus Thorarchaeota archaeon]|nr:tetratricopeptide repeat protein [Candidatus Thorarchaeota archaeon]
MQTLIQFPIGEQAMKGNNDDLVAESVRLIERGDLQGAVNILKILLEQHPDSLEGWYNLGFVLMELNNDEEAIKAFDEALAIDNQIFEIWFNKANSLYNLADFKHAKECYEKATEINPDDAEAWNNLGNCYSRLAEGQKAIEAYTRAVAVKPDYGEAFYNKANAHFIEEEDERAIAYADLAVELNPHLASKVMEWIHVSRDRLAVTESEEQHRERVKTLKELAEQDALREKETN